MALIVVGRFEGRAFEIEGRVDNILNSHIANTMCWVNAMRIDGYKLEDAPFYYGKIEGLGYLIPSRDLAIDRPAEIPPMEG